MEHHMARTMNGPQRTAVWIKAIGAVTAVALAALGAYVALHQTDPAPTNSCHGRTICGEDNDNNQVGVGEPAVKQ